MNVEFFNGVSPCVQVSTVTGNENSPQVIRACLACRKRGTAIIKKISVRILPSFVGRRVF
jgi:hypothetical protein